MTVSNKEVKRVATLSRLTLNEKEVEEYTKQMNSILKFAEKLDEINTNDIEPTSHVLNLKNVVREDVVRSSIPRDAALKNAPNKTEEFFKVPQVMEG